jgi:hypothetical protein
MNTRLTTGLANPAAFLQYVLDSQPKTKLGTYAYIAPEVITGRQ